MYRIVLFSAFVALTSAACAVDDGIPNFERMSEAELAEYNNGRPLSQMIVCVEDDRSFSRVRRTVCATVEAMYGSAAQADQLGVLNSVPGYSE
ncbi:MAG: hypothetical protein MRY76_04240 [Pseudomonadales bacterium]|jgi:hypothetical protein|nr:hypothetical protein [Pseudomonadales bacterium]